MRADHLVRRLRLRGVASAPGYAAALTVLLSSLHFDHAFVHGLPIAEHLLAISGLQYLLVVGVALVVQLVHGLTRVPVGDAARGPVRCSCAHVAGLVEHALLVRAIFGLSHVHRLAPAHLRRARRAEEAAGAHGSGCLLLLVRLVLQTLQLLLALLYLTFILSYFTI